MLRIGEFSKLGKTTIKTLRYYDEMGLLRPRHVDPQTGYRLYATPQLFQLQQIQSWRQMGLTVDEILSIQAGEEATAILRERKRQLLKQVENQRQQLLRIEFALSGRQKEEFMNFHALIKELPECKVMCREMVIPTYQDLLSAMPQTGEKVARQYPDLRCTTPEYCFIKEKDGEYREKDVHIEICQAVEELRPDFEDINFRIEPSVQAACVLVRGSYELLPQAYAYLIQWIEENGYQITDDSRESYLDGIWNKESVEDWLTEIQIPVSSR